MDTAGASPTHPRAHGRARGWPGFQGGEEARRGGGGRGVGGSCERVGLPGRGGSGFGGAEGGRHTAANPTSPGPLRPPAATWRVGGRLGRRVKPATSTAVGGKLPARGPQPAANNNRHEEAPPGARPPPARPPPRHPAPPGGSPTVRGRPGNRPAAPTRPSTEVPNLDREIRARAPSSRRPPRAILTRGPWEPVVGLQLWIPGTGNPQRHARPNAGGKLPPSPGRPPSPAGARPGLGHPGGPRGKGPGERAWGDVRGGGAGPGPRGRRAPAAGGRPRPGRGPGGGAGGGRTGARAGRGRAAVWTPAAAWPDSGRPFPQRSGEAKTLATAAQWFGRGTNASASRRLQLSLPGALAARGARPGSSASPGRRAARFGAPFPGSGGPCRGRSGRGQGQRRCRHFLDRLALGCRCRAALAGRPREAAFRKRRVVCGHAASTGPTNQFGFLGRLAAREIQITMTHKVERSMATPCARHNLEFSDAVSVNKSKSQRCIRFGGRFGPMSYPRGQAGRPAAGGGGEARRGAFRLARPRCNFHRRPRGPWVGRAPGPRGGRAAAVARRLCHRVARGRHARASGRSASACFDRPPRASPGRRRPPGPN